MTLTAVVLLVGLIAYLLLGGGDGKAKAAEVGRIWFLAAMIAWLIANGSKVIP